MRLDLPAPRSWREWRAWFAQHPVLIAGTVVWLEHIERLDTHQLGYTHHHYRIPTTREDTA